VAPVVPGVEHVLARLEAGAWTVAAEAPGYQTATATLTIADAGETVLEMALAPAGPFMPDLFGLTLAQAAQNLAQAGIPLLRLLDFTGRDLPPAAGPADSPDAPVLVQSPPAGTPIAAGRGAGLVIALPIEVEPAVEVPSLAGLTQQEAQKALESIGLVLGKVSFLQKA
jgi:beta-lactam-binding protein with PASTA domain